MKKFICILLALVALLSIFISYVQSNKVSKIINKYDKYSEEVYTNGLNTMIELSNTKTGEYLNDDGNVLTITSSDQIEYMFYKVNDSNNRYPRLRGDVCAIYLKKEGKYQGDWVKCEINICIEFRNKKTRVMIWYKSDDHSNTGIADLVYDYGNFTPDLTNETEKVQKADYMIKHWISAESLTEYYDQTWKYYDVLCSATDKNNHKDIVILFLSITFFLSFIVIRIIVKAHKEKSDRIIRNENQILAWEKMYNESMDDERYSTLKQLRLQIVLSDLDFSQEQRERVALLVSKIVNQSVELDDNDERVNMGEKRHAAQHAKHQHRNDNQSDYV